MEFIGNEFENAPTLFNIPVLFVVQTMGGVRLVVNSQVYSPFGVPPVPDTIKCKRQDWCARATHD
jgi:hypothetical protein